MGKKGLTKQTVTVIVTVQIETKKITDGKDVLYDSHYDYKREF